MRRYYAEGKGREALKKFHAKPEYKEKRKVYRKLAHVREAERLSQNRWYHKKVEADPDFLLNRYVKKYGLTAESYRALHERQLGMCAICGAELGREVNNMSGRPERLHVDHCHKTNVVRGLLCGRCNLCIGRMEDSPELLRRAANYLEGKV